MTINPLTSLQPSLFQPVSNNASAGNSSTVSSTTTPQDSTADISPTAVFLSMLQQVQQQNPGQFQQITTNIANKLQQAAKDAQSQGDSSRANQLNQLASQFQNAGTTGPLPSPQALQQAGIFSHHHHGGHHVHHSPESTRTDASSAYGPQITGTNTQDPTTGINPSLNGQ